ncbi:Type II secretory pathway component PulL [Burkholderia dolosa AU0158]|nr:Type II secretory pathway component PulL [Burkholderia dolosa AU0158]
MPLQEWQWPELPFTLVDKAGHVQRAGRAALALLPRANATVLIVAARDVLLLAATVPPLKGPKLRQALPNIVEDQLIQDPLGCHIALDPVALPDGRRVIVLVDGVSLQAFRDTFNPEGNQHLSVLTGAGGFTRMCTSYDPLTVIHAYGNPGGHQRREQRC